jgi:nucleotide-binding universal stress UspA family protein
MKTILIPMVNHEAMQSALETALLLARQYDGYMEGFALRPWIDAVALAHWAIPPRAHALGDIEDEVQAKEMFESFMRKHDVPCSIKAMRSSSFGWLNKAPEGDHFVGSYGRVFDVIVMNRLDLDSSGLYTKAIEAALFRSGRPLILSPPSPPQEIATNVLIVWGGSAEQARAVTVAMPFLLHADRVTVLSVGAESATAGPSVERLVQYLGCYGIDAEPLNVGGDGRNAGRVILTTAESLGCNLLINGVDAQSRWRLLFSRGTTRHFLGNAGMPVLLVN